MPERSFYGDVVETQLLEPKSYSATTTSGMITCDSNMVAVLVSVGLWTSGTFDFKLTESDKSDFSNPNDVAVTDFVATPALVQVAALTSDQSDFLIRYTGSKGYIKLVATGATSPSAVFGASVLKGATKRTTGAIV